MKQDYAQTTALRYVESPDTSLPSSEGGEECSGGCDSFTLLSGQAFLCNGVVFASESRGPGFKSWELELMNLGTSVLQ